VSIEHWRYFLALEQDLEATTRYVEPMPPNFATFSIEFARLLLSTCSEIDVVAKVLCQAIAPGQAANSIDDYRSTITSKYPQFHSIKVLLPRFTLAVTPWQDWSGTANPRWWRDHNLVKHMRHENFKLAHLENCVGALAGLFALVVYLYREDLFSFRLDPPPSLFRLPSQPVKLVSGSYELPDFPKGAA
jgi:hypothetical protein